MANNYYTFTPSFIPGQKVRSDEVNTQFAGVEDGFGNLPADADAIKEGKSYHGTEGGSGNSYTVTMDDTRTAYTDGDRVSFKATHTNTGAVSLSLDGIGLLPLVDPAGVVLTAGAILSGVFYEAIYDSSNNQFQLMSLHATLITDASDQVDYAEEWASKAEDSLVSTDAGGNGVDEYSALHWAAKAAADVVLTNADVVLTNADVVTCAGHESAAQGFASTAGTASIVAQGAATSAGNSEVNAAGYAAAALVSENNADGYATSASNDAIATAADAAATAIDAAATAQDAIDTAADAVSTAADAVSTAADAVSTAADAAALPTISGGDASKFLRVNVGETGYDFVALTATDSAAGIVELATDQEAFDGTDTSRAVTPASMTAGMINRSRTNMIINGGFAVWQRGDSFTSLAHGDYLADRWFFGNNTAATLDADRIEAIDTDLPFANSLKLDVTGAVALGASEYVYVGYKIEGIDCSHLKMGVADAREVTLSFWHGHTMTGTHTGSIRNNAANRSYTFEYTQTVADTMERSEVTFNLDTTGTWLFGEAEVGIFLTFTLDAGSTFQTTAGSWAAGNYLGTSNQVANVGSVSNFFWIGNVQLEVGNQRTYFDSHPVSYERVLCERYYYRKNAQTTDAIGYMGVRNSSLASGIIEFPTVMASIPTCSLSTPTTAANWDLLGISGEALSALTVGAVTTKSGMINWADSGTGMTAHQVGVLRPQTVAGYLEADAEI